MCLGQRCRDTYHLQVLLRQKVSLLYKVYRKIDTDQGLFLTELNSRSHKPRRFRPWTLKQAFRARIDGQLSLEQFGAGTHEIGRNKGRHRTVQSLN